MRIAVVHRKRYRHADGSEGDWVLPKGKSEPGESLVATALREVREETGWRARVAGAALSTEYPVGGETKRVTFFRMAAEEAQAERDADEIRELAWCEPAEAVRRLTYETERDVVRRAYGLED